MSGGLRLRVDRTLDLERVSRTQPGEYLIQYFRQVLAPMIPRDGLMQVPPDPLDRAEVRRGGRQQVVLDPALPLPEVLDHLQTGVTARVVADHVDLLGPTQPLPQLIQVLEEQGPVPPL